MARNQPGLSEFGSGWPRPRRRGEVWIVSGWYVSAARWTIALRLIRLLLAAVGLAMLASSLVALPVALIDGRSPPVLIDRGLRLLVDLRYVVENLFVRFPGFSETVMYRRGQLIDWHMAGIALVILMVRKPLARPLAALTGLFVPFLTQRRFSITIGTDMVRIGGILGRRILRGAPGCDTISFRVRRLQPELGREDRALEEPAVIPEWRQPPAFLELIHGFSTVRLLYLRDAARGEQIAARCNELLGQTTRLIRIS